METTTSAHWREGRHGTTVIWPGHEDTVDIDLEGCSRGVVVIRDNPFGKGPDSFTRSLMLDIIRRSHAVYLIVGVPLLPEVDLYSIDEDTETEFRPRTPNDGFVPWTTIIHTAPETLPRWRAFVEFHNGAAGIALIRGPRDSEWIRQGNLVEFRRTDLAARQHGGAAE